MSLKKLPFITSVKLAQVDGRSVIPSIIYYDADKRPHVGQEARDLCPNPEQLIEEFKIQLGQYDPDAVTRRTTQAHQTPRQTVVAVAQDFFNQILGKVNSWLEMQGRPLPQSILIAEPLSLGGTDMADEAWLSNYRRSIKRALQSKFETIDFMPEPFAVFQYYRYGLRHPLIAEKRTHIALVLDFGGGTFDVSVIRTTKTGDVSQTGVHSRPLSAKSLRVGGYFINRLIAADLLHEAADQRIKSDIRKALDFFDNNLNPDEELLSSFSGKRRSFFIHYKRLLNSIENGKLAVCNSIANWSLEADLSGAVPFPISVPTDPFVPTPQMANLKLDGGRLRNIFEHRVWKERLRDAISRTINRASDELKGEPISIVLLSGGSSNIRWLTKLVIRDLGGQLGEAHVLELNENFQEIVAKGLATECARRFYTEGQGDFRGVTYNRLCLALRSDGGELEIKRAKQNSDSLNGIGRGDDNDDGVLLPSASSLRGLIGKPLSWKVRLSSPPGRVLEYYFMRSSFDPEDLDALYNIVDYKAETPPNTKFQSAIEVELMVRDDGTAEPRFIYGRNDRRPGVSVDGRPFYIDMTFASEEVGGTTYLGFDFGTSTSACSLVDSVDVHLIEERNKAPEWRDLTELISSLPYPVAVPLARFVSEVDNDKRQVRGRDAAEALLTLAAYMVYMEVCASKPARSSYFKNMAHRSAGPLWALLKQCLASHPQNLTFSAPLLALVQPNTTSLIDSYINDIADDKHGKAASVDYVSFLGTLANQIARVFRDNKLGVFEGVTAKRFDARKFKGLFRELSGSSQTFVHVSEYEGEVPFSDENVYVVNSEVGQALCLSPLYFWGLNRFAGGNIEPDLFEFDNIKKDTLSYKSTQYGPALKIDADGELKEIFEIIAEMKGQDQRGEILQDLGLHSHESDG